MNYTGLNLTCSWLKYLNEPQKRKDLGDNNIKIFHLWRYIVRYTVENLALQRHMSGAVKHELRPYIQQYLYTPK